MSVILTKNGEYKNFDFVFLFKIIMRALTYKDLELKVLEKVYFPREDSFLVLENLKFKKGEKILELGTGSGIIAIFAAKQDANVVATDISRIALKCAADNAKQNNVEIEFVNSNLFENVRGKFDKIIFNAPYLPGERKTLFDKAESGGPTGNELLLKAVKESQRFLKKDGALYVVCSSLSGRFLEKLKLKKKYNYKIIDEKAFFFERIFLVQISTN
ncbi:MAG: hypothetical protein CVU81_01180 [Euryarchaeota archaeon HGW-Euryarchaeota-1]|nr:MAG: hypothetical protein CVU81_01180 [Euryarchaeota archaeon HGW-Euryarchaeota-1]